MPFSASRAASSGRRLKKVVDTGGLWRRAGHVADEMNNDVATLDIGPQDSERIAAERLEILLDLDLDIRPRQRAAQFVAIVAELVRDAGEKELDVRHSPPPAPMAARPMWHGGPGSAKGGRDLWRLMGFACVSADTMRIPLLDRRKFSRIRGRARSFARETRRDQGRARAMVGLDRHFLATIRDL
jgi:hypothetical protein